MNDWEDIERILAVVNANCPDWRLTSICELGKGQSGAKVHLCENHNERPFVIKSFADPAQAMRELAAGHNASKHFGFQLPHLGEEIALQNGACFVMAMAGDIKARPLADLVRQAIADPNGRIYSVAQAAIDAALESVKCKPDGVVQAFKPITIDPAGRQRLSHLDPKLAADVLDWWDRQCTHPDACREVAVAFAHGDFHSNNVIVQAAHQPPVTHVIDFATSGAHPIFKDAARLERDIRFSVFCPPPMAGRAAGERYLDDQAQISGYLRISCSKRLV